MLDSSVLRLAPLTLLTVLFPESTLGVDGDLRVLLELQTSFSRDVDELHGQRCVPTTPEVVIPEPVATASTACKAQARTAVGTIEVSEATTSALEFLSFEPTDARDNHIGSKRLALRNRVIVDHVVPSTSETDSDDHLGPRILTLVQVTRIVQDELDVVRPVVLDQRTAPVLFGEPNRFLGKQVLAPFPQTASVTVPHDGRTTHLAISERRADADDLEGVLHSQGRSCEVARLLTSDLGKDFFDLRVVQMWAKPSYSVLRTQMLLKVMNS